MTKKFLHIFIGSCIALCAMVTSAYASADITATVKSTATNSITLTIKNNGREGRDINGGLYSVVDLRIRALNTVTNTEDALSTTRIAGGISNDIVIGNLSPNTVYSITIVVDEGASRNTKTLTATTKADPQQNLPPRPLYVQFVQTATVVSENSVSITIKNTGTKNFNAVVVAKNAANGVEVGRSTILVGAGLDALRVFGNLAPGRTYNFSLTGTEVGSNRPFQTARYDGVTTKTPPVAGASAQNQQTTCTAPQVLVNGVCTTSANQCNDGIDNQKGDGRDYGYGKGEGDRKADHRGVDTIISNGKGDGIIDIEPDPSCFSPTATEEKGDDVVSRIIPCTDKCTFTDVFRLLNNFITFFFTVLLIPIFIILVMFAGFKYITAEGNPSKVADLKKMLLNFVKGIVLILCAWLIVRTIMTTVLNEEFKKSGVELLEN